MDAVAVAAALESGESGEWRQPEPPVGLISFDGG